MIHCRSSPAPGLQRTVLALATHWPFLEKPRIYATSSLISFGFSFSSNFGIFFLPLVTIWTRLASLSVSVSGARKSCAPVFLPALVFALPSSPWQPAHFALYIVSGSLCARAASENTSTRDAEAPAFLITFR